MIIRDGVSLASFRLTAFGLSSRRGSAARGEYRPSGPQKPGDVIAGAFAEKCRSGRDRRLWRLGGGSKTQV